MTKKIISASLVFLLLALTAVPSSEAQAASTSFITAPSAILIDGLTGRPIYSKSPHLRRPQASTTKVMTAMVVLDKMNLNDVIVIPRRVEAVQPSKLYLKGGEKYYVKDLIYAILMKSANDAAEALAIRVGGSVPGFCKLMNEKARSLGAKNTIFKTPNGLPAKGQYSTAYDLALIMRRAERYPFLVKALTMKSTTIQSLGGRKIFFKSHNKMLWSEKFDVIGKTGYTRSSSYCFVGRINEKYKDVFLGLLGSKKLWVDVRRLCSYPNAKMLTAIRTNQRLWARQDILTLQERLFAEGYSVGPIDGEFSFQTLAAVEAFQRDHKLPVNGIVNEKLWSALSNSR